MSPNLISLVIVALVFSFDASARKNELRAVRQTMPGLLTSAGGAGGENSLNDELVEKTCNQGYSTIFYLYSSAFSNKGTHHCHAGQVEYLHAHFEGSGLKSIFRRVQQVADHGGGPVLVHCWNGRHAAGAVMAYALQQFCGWSGKDAEAYWLRNAIDGEGYTKLRRNIRNFQPYGEFGLSSSQRSAHCP